MDYHLQGPAFIDRLACGEHDLGIDPPEVKARLFSGLAFVT